MTLQNEQQQDDSAVQQPATASAPAGADDAAAESTVPSSNEVRIGRRRFTAQYKQRMLVEAAACGHGELGLLLRKEGLYHGQLVAWRKQAAQQQAGVLVDQKRGRKPLPVNPLQAQVDQLSRALKRSEERLGQAQAIISLQKKVSEMLGLMQPSEVA
jgi:transposase